MSIEKLSINTIRTLTIDATRKANSGHPGAPMALAPVAYALYKEIMHHNPNNPRWINRDRFILSNGHASMLLYAILHLTGYDISLEELKNFRQWNSKTPGHPEHDLDLGVETTTGPLGQGFMNGIGMALAEAHLAEKFNKDDLSIIDYYTYVLCSDGDLMEGASHEAASLAGHLGLDKMIAIYDDNHISIEGPTDLAYSDDVEQRFKSYNWHVQNIGENANNIETLTEALENAKAEKERPSIIIVRTHIGYGSPNMQDTSDVHGAPLDEDEIVKTKENYGWPTDKKFYVPDEVKEHMSEVIPRGEKFEKEWNQLWDKYQDKYPELAQSLKDALNGKLPADLDDKIANLNFDIDAIATRKASQKVINEVIKDIPHMVGGSADLSPSTKTIIDESDYIQKGAYSNRNLTFGVREHAMCGMANGMALNGGMRPFVGTFLVFSDYARPSIRMASIMKLPVIYIMTHDSIGIGEDGPTHQPVEHVSSLRLIPNLAVIRPADANEVKYAWLAAVKRQDSPTLLALTRQSLPVLDRTKLADAKGTLKGAYILSEEEGQTPDVILLASGSEIQLVVEAQESLREKDIDARVVSMPSWELFEEQSDAYKENILPSSVKNRLAIEAGVKQGWNKYVGDKGVVMGVEKFGSSAPYQVLFEKYGLTVENIVQNVKDMEI